MDDFFVEATIVFGISILYLTMGSAAAMLKLEPWAIGSWPGEDVDDEAEAEAAVAAHDMAFPIYVADWSMNMLLFSLVVCQAALFGTGLSDVRALMAFRVPGYQRVAGTGLIVMGLVALYFQASKGEGMGKGEEADSLGYAYLLGTLVVTISLMCGLPLKKVLNGDRVDLG